MGDDLIEIRWHGRGGQGAVLASRIVAKAAFLEGKWSQAFPFFGAERRGAPVMAFTRVSGSPIRLRSQIYEPDILVLLDPMFLNLEVAWRGVKPDTIVVMNVPEDPAEIFLPKRVRRLATVDATAISMELGLKVAGLPVPNSAMVGALVKATGIVGLESAESSVKAMMKRLTDVNLEALKRAHEETKVIDNPKFVPEVIGEG
ncbi:MAG: 2-oxoacid:acceptor oxidoreductase family protein [Candidatus Korarchaeota archaeon]|nr:2-oxoacid:acceptor oxidoreductase family protein [Candidatus Korarchaeota archaeon]